jgi:hypothetical protein
MALDLIGELEQTAQQAPLGCTLDACEAYLLNRGRQFLRDSLAATLQQQISDAEKKGGPRGPVPVDRHAATRASAAANSSPPSAPSA